MDPRSFTLAYTIDAPPEAVFAAAANVRGWWSEDVRGETDRPGAVFQYRFRDIHRCTAEITEFVPNERIAWLVLDNMFSFTQDPREWTGTRMIFEITPNESGTHLRFTHDGLTPEDECFEACHQGWTTYIGRSLRRLIESGRGEPNLGTPVTEKERALAV